MSRTITASDRKSLIRLAASLPKGSEERRAVLAGLKTSRMEDMEKFESEAKKIYKEVQKFAVKLAQWDHQYGDDVTDPVVKKSFSLVSQAQSKLDEAAHLLGQL